MLVLNLNSRCFNLRILRSQRLIRAAFLKSDLLKHLDDKEIKAMLPFMYPTTINQGCYVFQEETIGAQAYVLEGKSIFHNADHIGDICKCQRKARTG